MNNTSSEIIQEVAFELQKQGFQIGEMLVQNVIDVYSKKQLERIENGDPTDIPGLGTLSPIYRKVAPTATKRGYTVKFKVDLNPKLKSQLIKKLETNDEFRKKLDINNK